MRHVVAYRAICVPDDLDPFRQAANSFKLEKLFKESGDAFAKEADCRDRQGERDEAANAWWNSAKAVRLVSSASATRTHPLICA